jgi:hypothetical protein
LRTAQPPTPARPHKGGGGALGAARRAAAAAPADKGEARESKHHHCPRRRFGHRVEVGLEEDLEASALLAWVEQDADVERAGRFRKGVESWKGRQRIRCVRYERERGPARAHILDADKIAHAAWFSQRKDQLTSKLRIGKGDD